VICSGTNSTLRAVSAKFTEALVTPCKVLTNVSVLAAHEAHDIPVTGYIFDIWILADIDYLLKN
jgi:hypothetical protein